MPEILLALCAISYIVIVTHSGQRGFTFTDRSDPGSFRFQTTVGVVFLVHSESDRPRSTAAGSSADRDLTETDTETDRT